MKRNVEDFRLRFKRWKNGESYWNIKYNNGKDNEIPELLQPLIQDQNFQEEINNAKSSSRSFNISDFIYRTLKYRPNITEQQVSNIYNNTPIISRNVPFGEGIRKNNPDKEKLDKVRNSILNVASINNPIYDANNLLLAKRGKDNFKYTNKYNISIPNFKYGKDDEEDLEESVKIGSVIEPLINQKLNEAKVKNNIKLDRKIASKPYGWDDYGPSADRGFYSLYNSVRHINPAWGFYDVGNAASSVFDSAFDIETDMSGATKDDIAFWQRHLGLKRDTTSMPIRGIRFSGDYNKDGTVRLPNAEYTGVSQKAKDFIRKGIETGKIKVKKGRLWTGIKEDREWSKYTSHLGNYSIRENNNSGIYDLYDTYDFPSHVWINNRKPGTQIEIRDTIHGKNAKPYMYDPNYYSKKKK